MMDVEENVEEEGEKKSVEERTKGIKRCKVEGEQRTRSVRHRIKRKTTSKKKKNKQTYEIMFSINLSS